MEHYVTLLDHFFLPQGLALHQSMERYAEAYTLWILCLDLQSYTVLKDLSLPNTCLLSAEELETPELKAVKPSRTRGEYCWTTTPFAPRFVFEADNNIKRVTYVDADLWFLREPIAIFKELDSSRKKVLVTEHAYAPGFDQSDVSGRFCVQFLTFSRMEGELVRKWWEERCLEWCHDYVEDGKYGDQKYLDCWPDLFSEQVHILKQKHFALAPWNATQFSHEDAVFFHFHGLRIVSDKTINLGQYRLPDSLLKNVYIPYFNDLKTSVFKLEKVGFSFKSQAKSLTAIHKFYYFLKAVYKISRSSMPQLTVNW